jgi:hypothetical protein
MAIKQGNFTIPASAMQTKLFADLFPDVGTKIRTFQIDQVVPDNALLKWEFTWKTPSEMDGQVYARAKETDETGSGWQWFKLSGRDSAFRGVKIQNTQAMAVTYRVTLSDNT